MEFTSGEYVSKKIITEKNDLTEDIKKNLIQRITIITRRENRNQYNKKVKKV